MRAKRTLLFFMLSLLLCWSITACDRSLEAEKSSASAVSQSADPDEKERPPAPVQLPLISETAQSAAVEPASGDVQAGSCGPEIAESSGSLDNSYSAMWQQIESHPALDGIASISTGSVFDAAGYGWKPGISYAIANDGTAWFWGLAKRNTDFPQPIQGLDRVSEITESFALTTDGQLWKLNEEKAAAKMNGLNDIRSIRQLSEMTGMLFMLKQNGTVWKLDHNEIIPERQHEFENVRGIYGSYFSLFILAADGKLLYMDGRAGGNRFEHPYTVEMSDRVEQVAVGGDDQALLQSAKGETYSFSPDDKTLKRLPFADHAKRMAVGGGGLFLLVKADGSVWGWGQNNNGMLGEKRPDTLEQPVQIEGLANIGDIQAGTDHALALDDNGHVYSWGSNMTGQLGRLATTFDRWTELGELGGIEQVVTRLGRPYFVRKDGSVWGLKDDRVPYQVNGPSNILTLTSVFGVPITLSSDGKIRIWPDHFGSCQYLSVPFPVKDMAGGEDHLLLRSEDDRLWTVKLKPEIGKQGDRRFTKAIVPEKLELAQTDTAMTKRVKSLYSNHYTFFVLTDDGRVYYADKAEDKPFTFKLIPDLQHIKQLAPEYFIRYTLEPASVWALDDSGRVYEIIVNRLQTDGPKLKAIEAAVSPGMAEDGIAAISGRLRITKDGRIFEHDWSPFQSRTIPNPVRLTSSSYAYAIEGPGSHYHVLVTDTDKLVAIGHNPFGTRSSIPGTVVVRPQPDQ